MFFSQYEIDALILEDVPLHDETVRSLGMPNVRGEMMIHTREAGVMSGMRLLAKMARRSIVSLRCSLRMVKTLNRVSW